MKTERIHMVPQVVVDCAENLFASKFDHMKQNYILRLETIRDYCDEALRKERSTNTMSATFKKKSK